MKQFEVTYTQGDSINKKEVIEAEDGAKASTLFYMEHPGADITKIEEVTEE